MSLISPDSSTLVMHCLLAKIQAEVTSKHLIRINTITDGFSFEMATFKRTDRFGSVTYKDGTIAVNQWRWSNSSTYTDVDRAAEYAKGVSIGDPTFSLDEIVTIVQDMINTVDEQLGCDPITELHAAIAELAKKRKAFKLPIHGQYLTLKVTSDSIVTAGTHHHKTPPAASITFKDNKITVKSEYSPDAVYELLEGGYTTKYEIITHFFEVVKLWCENQEFKNTGKKDGYHRGRTKR